MESEWSFVDEQSRRSGDDAKEILGLFRPTQDIRVTSRPPPSGFPVTLTFGASSNERIEMLVETRLPLTAEEVVLVLDTLGSWRHLQDVGYISVLQTRGWHHFSFTALIHTRSALIATSLQPVLKLRTDRLGALKYHPCS